MDVTKCDRCRKEIGPAGIDCDDREVFTARINPDNQFDLCGTCVEELREWKKGHTTMGAHLRRELTERGTDYAAMQAVVPMCCQQAKLLMGVSADGMLIACCKKCGAWSFDTGVLPPRGTGGRGDESL